MSLKDMCLGGNSPRGSPAKRGLAEPGTPPESKVTKSARKLDWSLILDLQRSSTAEKLVFPYYDNTQRWVFVGNTKKVILNPETGEIRLVGSKGAIFKEDGYNSIGKQFLRGFGLIPGWTTWKISDADDLQEVVQRFP